MQPRTLQYIADITGGELLNGSPNLTVNANRN